MEIKPTTSSKLSATASALMVFPALTLCGSRKYAFPQQNPKIFKFQLEKRRSPSSDH